MKGKNIFILPRKKMLGEAKKKTEPHFRFLNNIATNLLALTGKTVGKQIENQVQSPSLTNSCL